MKRLFALFVLGIACAAVSAESPHASHGGCLEMCMATVEGDNLVLTATVLIPVYEKRLVKKKVDGKEVEVEETVQRTVAEQRTEKLALKKIEAFSGNGKPIPPQMLAARLKEPTPVFKSFGWAGDSPFKGQLRDEAIVLRVQMPDLLKEHLRPEKKPPQEEKVPQPLDK
jgi:hypothetical protein